MEGRHRRLQLLAQHVAATSAGPLLNVEGGKSPWAGFGIGSYDGPTPADSAQLLEPCVHRQLFVDNYALASTTGIRRKLHRPRKVPGAVLRSPIPGFGVQSRCAPQWDPERRLWEWWLIAQREDAGDGAGADGGGDGGRAQLPAAELRAEKFFAVQRGDAKHEEEGEAYHPDDIRARATDAPVTDMTLYATSTDGEAWVYPELRLFEYNGSWANAIAVDPAGDILYHIVRDEDEPDPARRYKGLFGIAGRKPAVSLGINQSHCHFRTAATEHGRKSGMKWLSFTAK
jgi:hypothetical protein